MYDDIFSMGNGKPFPPPLPNVEDYIVGFDGEGDHMHPYNWKRSTKYVNFLPRILLICMAGGMRYR